MKKAYFKNVPGIGDLYFDFCFVKFEQKEERILFENNT